VSFGLARAASCLVSVKVRYCGVPITFYPRLLLLMRSVVSYDDLEQVTTTPAPGPPPAKKRKRQQNKRKSLGPQKFAHWDDPAGNYDVPFANRNYASDPEDETVGTEES
jgi:hypothetical protein